MFPVNLFHQSLGVSFPGLAEEGFVALTKRERNMIIGIVAVVAIAAIVGAFFLGRSGGDENAATTPTATQTTQTTPTQTVVTVTVPSEPSPAPEPEPAPTASLEIVARSVVPEVISAGMPMEFIAEVQGSASSVTMSIRGPADSTVSLTRGVTSPGGITVWRATANAPATPGIYRYYASAVSAADGSTVEMPGVSGWSFQVTP
jgi:hypothetical protein